jgi:uncharacterized protein YdcH (DUF465 family)
MAQAQLPQDEEKAAFIRQDAAYQQLVSEHHALEERLRHLSAQTYLSSDQQLTETTLKKRKLALKDQIEALARRQAAPGRSA